MFTRHPRRRDAGRPDKDEDMTEETKRVTKCRDEAETDWAQKETNLVN